MHVEYVRYSTCFNLMALMWERMNICIRMRRFSVNFKNKFWIWIPLMEMYVRNTMYNTSKNVYK